MANRASESNGNNGDAKNRHTELTRLIYAADSVLNAEVFGDDVMTVDAAYLTEQCEVVKSIYSK